MAMPQPYRPIPASGSGVSPAAFGKSLQLTRASTMALTRLQLALTRADKHQARVAMDCLLDIDAELEGFVADLSIPQGLEDPEWQSISEHLKTLKTAIAFEKLVLAGEMTGPALTSETQALPIAPPVASMPQPEPAGWPVAEPANDGTSEYKAVDIGRWLTPALALLAMLAIGGMFLLAYTLL